MTSLASSSASTEIAGPWDVVVAAEIIAAHVSLEGAALPILHALQEEFTYVPRPAEPMIAEALNISRAEVHGLISFYHDFRRAPTGRHVLKVCRAEACQATGGPALAERLMQRLGIGWGETTRDRSLTVEPAYCLGLCACGPAALLDGAPLARLDDAVFNDMVEETRRT